MKRRPLLENVAYTLSIENFSVDWFICSTIHFFFGLILIYILWSEVFEFTMVSFRLKSELLCGIRLHIAPRTRLRISVANPDWFHTEIFWTFVGYLYGTSHLFTLSKSFTSRCRTWNFHALTIIFSLLPNPWKLVNDIGSIFNLWGSRFPF